MLPENTHPVAASLSNSAFEDTGATARAGVSGYEAKLNVFTAGGITNHISAGNLHSGEFRD